MNLKDINILFWDNPTNFSLENTKILLGIVNDESKRYKEVYPFYNEKEYIDALLKIKDDDLVLVLCHIDFGNKYIGNELFEIFLENSNISRDKIKYVSSNKDAHSDFVNNGSTKKVIHTYNEIYENINSGKIVPYTKRELLEGVSDSNLNERKQLSSTDNTDTKHYKYAIFTALYEEFLAIQDLFEWKKDLEEKTGTMTYRFGTLKGTSKSVVAGFPDKTGMTEAAVICTEMIYRYEPKFLLMPGVCGGSNKTEFGDVIVASKVFLLGKGKITDAKEVIEGVEQKVILHYKKVPLELNEITDSNGKMIRITCEVLEEEIDAISINEGLSQDLVPKLKDIEERINYHRQGPNEKIKVRFEPMACSLSVIDKEGYFEVNILTKDRKTKALEMESYGVARAAQKANGGITKFLIFKSVMDKTDLKTDNYKNLAAYTSAQFLKYLLEDNVI